MAALPYIQLYVADYLADTAHLSTEEHGAYLLLIMNYWQRGKALPNDDKRLALITRLSNERWTDVKQTLNEFFNITPTEWQHARIERDLAEAYKKSIGDNKRPSAEVWKKIREFVFLRDDYTCRYCGQRGVRLECDHVYPVSRGGSHDAINLVTSCFKCNRSKRDKTVEEWKGGLHV